MPAKQHRILRGDDYRSTVRNGNRVGGAFCITHAVLREPGEPARFGFIVAKNVGNAVVRNRVRRRMKTVADRRLHAGLDGIDLVFRALPASAEAAYHDLEREMNRSIARSTAAFGGRTNRPRIGASHE